jgi:hypothetical protein
VDVRRALCCHLRAGFQQCKSFVEMGESVLFIGNSVTSTPQWIRQPEASWGCVWCLCVSMYSDILGSLSL